MHSALTNTAHRPWALPPGPWKWRQTWGDVLFAHWPVPANILRPFVPSQLEIQEFKGTSWVGIVPFQMSGVMKRPLPDLPYFSRFPELNLRLYVEFDGKAGVWFLSLDASNAFAVWAARRLFHLPYHHAKMSLMNESGEYRFTSRRLDSPKYLLFNAQYRPTGAASVASVGSLEHWLTERYCLYAQSPKGHLFRADVHHKQWELYPAEAEIYQNQLTTPFGFELSGKPALLHFSHDIDVIAWSPEQIDI